MELSTSLLRLVSFCAAITACTVATAQKTRPRFALNYIPHSTHKVEQINGDYDWADLAKGKYTKTTSQTITRFNIAGNDIGYSFEHEGNLIFLFGDTISNNPSEPWGQHSSQPFVRYYAGDPMAWSQTTDPDDGLLINVYIRSGTPSPRPLFVKPPGIAMGPDDVPNSGISLNGQIPEGSGCGFYILCNTNSNVNMPHPHQADYSVLACFDEQNSTFYTGRAISKLNPHLPPNDIRQGHFIIDAFREDPSNLPIVWMFGVGEYRESDVYLSFIPKDTFWAGYKDHLPTTQYFAGLSTGGTPVWDYRESHAVPVVFDNPLDNQKPWPNDNPTIGNFSVAYSYDLPGWLMTFDGGRQEGPNKDDTTGVYFCYSLSGFPWGPWSQPQLIFNAIRDDGFGDFIHNPDYNPSGPAGPIIGQNSLDMKGAVYAPHMIGRFTKINGDTLSIYYTMSTWNPYSIVLMRSDFKIRRIY